MKRFYCLFFSFLLFAETLYAQTAQGYASDAFTLVRLVEKYHVEPRSLDISFSELFFDHFFVGLDENKLIFTQQEMLQYQHFREKLHLEVLNQKTDFLKIVSQGYELGIHRIDSLLKSMDSTPFSFTNQETFTIQEDSNYAADKVAQYNKMRKLLKKEILDEILTCVDLKSSLSVSRQIQICDSLEPAARKKIIDLHLRSISRILKAVRSIAQQVGILYCETLASGFDPHTSYMPEMEKENFESELGNKLLLFGFSLEQVGQSVIIHDLKPGTAAYKSGQLNAKDIITAIQWANRKQIDLLGATVEEVAAILSESNSDKIWITVKKADGILRTVELQKELADPEEDERIKSFLLKNDKEQTAYISLPAFYTDFQNKFNTNGCANDIAKEILRLKKQHINGLILDLRYNGGGSLQEAIDLSGIFIDAGPVAQVFPSNGKTYTLKDINRGTVFDGPLVVLVNGASASASEMVAGTLQDYHRAIIMGTPTYGKATAQVIMPLDSLTKPTGFNLGSSANAFIKLTIEKIYRVTGFSAQTEGVLPDVLLPDKADHLMKRERDDFFYLQARKINANAYYTPYALEQLTGYIRTGKSLVDSASIFRKLKEQVLTAQIFNRKGDIPLQITSALKRNEMMLRAWNEMDLKNNDNDFDVLNLPREESKLLSLQEPDQKETNNQWKDVIKRDPWIWAAFQIINKQTLK
jgi:carboxyl-terminal processing protease